MNNHKENIHEWFELTYANYLTIPRSILQSMPDKWQEKFVECLNELDETFDWRRDGIRVVFRNSKGRLIPSDLDEFSDYERGRRIISKEECKRLVKKWEKIQEVS